MSGRGYGLRLYSPLGPRNGQRVAVHQPALAPLAPFGLVLNPRTRLRNIRRDSAGLAPIVMRDHLSPEPRDQMPQSRSSHSRAHSGGTRRPLLLPKS